MRLHGDAYFFIKRQFAYLVVGVVLAVSVAMFDYRKWRDTEVLTWLFFVVVMVLLVAVFGFLLLFFLLSSIDFLTFFFLLFSFLLFSFALLVR